MKRTPLLLGKLGVRLCPRTHRGLATALSHIIDTLKQVSFMWLRMGHKAAVGPSLTSDRLKRTLGPPIADLWSWQETLMPLRTGMWEVRRHFMLWCIAKCSDSLQLGQHFSQALGESPQESWSAPKHIPLQCQPKDCQFTVWIVPWWLLGSRRDTI